MAVVFLDFEGVLRRASSQRYQLDADLVEALESTVRRFPDVEIVITSSWREAFNLDDFRSHFSPDIRLRIVGATPIARRLDGHYRHREVLAWLKAKGLEGERWVAVDDDGDHYPGGRPGRARGRGQGAR